jgi:hypothetical protein
MREAAKMVKKNARCRDHGMYVWSCHTTFFINGC